MIPIAVLTTTMEITLFGWLGAGLLPVMIISLGRIGVLAWREGGRYAGDRRRDATR